MKKMFKLLGGVTLAFAMAVSIVFFGSLQAKAAENKTVTVTVSVERFTIGQGFYVEPTQVTLPEGKSALDAIYAVCGEKNLNVKASFYGGNYIAGIKGADLGKDKVKIPEYIYNPDYKINGPTLEKALKEGNADDELGEYDYASPSDGYYSGWCFFANNEYASVTADQYILKNDDVIRLQFSLTGESDLDGISWDENYNPVKVCDISNKDEAIKTLAKVNQKKSTLLLDSDVKSTYNDVYAKVQNAIVPQNELDAAVVKLQNAVNNYKAPTSKPSAPVVVAPSIKAGMTVKSSSGKETVKVLSAAKRTVEYVKPSKKTYKSVTVPSTVKISGKTYKVSRISSGAFKGMTKLQKVTIGSNVEKIGSKAFYKCKKLKKITILSKKLSKSKVGSKAFYGTKKKAVVKVPKSKYKAYKKFLSKKGNKTIKVTK